MAESRYDREGEGLSEGVGLEGGASNIKVVASILQPRLYNKTVPVAMGTTVNDVISMLVTKYAITAEDRDPSSFYLMEVRGGACLIRTLEMRIIRTPHYSGHY